MQMELSIGIFVLVYILLAFEIIEKSVAALLGGCAVIMTGLVTFDQAVESIDMNVLFLLIGMMTCVAILAETGFFECVAIFVAKSMKGNAAAILAMMLALTMVFSALLDNVTTIILLAPVTILITQLLELPTVPFLILEALASNIGGTATLIGDPPNIIISSQVELSFIDFIVHLAPGVVVIAIVFIAVSLLIMRKHLKVSEQVKLRVINSYPALAIVNKKKMIISLAVFGLIFLGFSLHHVLHVQPGVIALGGMCLMLVFCKTESEEMLKAVEWDAILFFIGLFIVIGALEHNHVIDKLAEVMLHYCADSLWVAAVVILIGSAFFSAILDNIPFVIAMTPMVQKLIVKLDPAFLGVKGELAFGSHPLFWALALGACLGGNGTIIGASANVVAAKIGQRNGYKISFLGFMAYGVPFMVLTVILAVIYMWLRYF